MLPASSPSVNGHNKIVVAPSPPASSSSSTFLHPHHHNLFIHPPHPPPPPTSSSTTLPSTSSKSILGTTNAVESLDAQHRNKLELICSSLQRFEQKWEEEEEDDEEEAYDDDKSREEGTEDDERDESDDDQWKEMDGWRSEMIDKVTEAGYDQESAYYALRLINFRSAMDAIEVLASVKQNLVKQHLHNNSNTQTVPSSSSSSRSLVFLNGSSTSAPPPLSASSYPPSSSSFGPSPDHCLPPADPFPPNITDQQHTARQPRALSPPHVHARRHSHSFDFDNVSSPLPSSPTTSNIPSSIRHFAPAGTVIRIERNQSERNERMPKMDRQQEKHPLKVISTTGREGQRAQQQKKSFAVGSAFSASPNRSSPFQTPPRPVHRIFVAPQGIVAPPPQEFSLPAAPDQWSSSIASDHQISHRLDSITVSSPPHRSTVTRCVSPLPESVTKKLKSNTYERAVKPCRAPMFRFFMEQHIEKLLQQYKERNQRAMQLIQEMELAGLADPVKEQMLRLLRQKESKYIRLRRQKMNRSMFDLIRHIGIGAFGKVTLVRKKDTEQVYAMKTLVKADVIQKQQAAHVKAERDILAEANSPWIVKLFFSFQDVENLYFIMEYVPGGDMMQLLINMGIFAESLARFYIAELTLAVEYVHSLGFIHRDIKPDNILIDRGGHIKLTDFGLCTGLRWTHDKRHYVVYEEQPPNGAGGIAHLREDSFSLPPGLDRRVKVLEMRHHRKRDRAHSVVGTGNYMAPEVVQKTGHTQLCDWWSVGVILYEMVYGRPPFMSQRDDPAETQFMIVHWKRFLNLRNSREAHLSRNCVDCVAKLCCDQDHRMGHRNGSKDIKAHPWFKGIDFDNLRNTTPEYVPRVQHPEDTSNFDTFEVRSDELRKGNGNNLRGSGGMGGPGKSSAPNFIDFTFRHFFSEGMGPAGVGASRSTAQCRPSLAPLFESSAEGGTEGKGKKAKQPTKMIKVVPFTSAKRTPAPPIPLPAAKIVQIGATKRRNNNTKNNINFNKFSINRRGPFQGRLDEAVE